MGKALLKHCLECVVTGIGDGIFGKDVAEYRDPIRRATGAGERVATRGGERPQADKLQSLSSASQDLSARHVELEAVRNGYAPLRVLQEGAALGRRSE